MKFGINKKEWFFACQSSNIYIFEKLFDFWVQYFNTRLLIYHTTILKKKILTIEDPKLLIQIKREIFISGTKNKNPLAQGYRMPTEPEFGKKILKTPHRNVYRRFFFLKWQVSKTHSFSERDRSSNGNLTLSKFNIRQYDGLIRVVAFVHWLVTF